jgi:hypothetical protein
MSRKRIYSNATVRSEAHAGRLKRSGGRVLTARLSPESLQAAKAMIDRGEAASLNEAINRALRKAAGSGK